MLAFRLRPKKVDDYRKYWNMYHHFLGYALNAVIPINIFLGTSILRPEHQTWRSFYIGVLVVFAAIVVVLEVYTWIKFAFLPRENTPGSKPPGTSNTPATGADNRSQTEQANQQNQITPMS